MRISRVVVVVILLLLIVFFIAGFFLAGEALDNRAVLRGIIRTVAVLVVVGAFLLLIRIGYDAQWTGFGEAVFPKQETIEVRPKKTLWDWLYLLSALAIPVVLAGVGLWFTWHQDARQQRFERQLTLQAQELENQRARQAQTIETQRAEAEQALAEQRAQNEALQAYLNQMSPLMLEKNLGDAKAGDPEQVFAQARTLTTLERLDPERKETIIEFLFQAKLIVKDKPVLSLATADLTKISFGGEFTSAKLPAVNFDGAVLTEVQLKDATLTHAYMRHAGLAGAQLQRADLEGADLSNAHLASPKGLYNQGEPLEYVQAADLRGANLRQTTLTNAFLKEVDMSRLRGWNLPPNLRRDDSRTNLTGADLRYAFMVEADLRDAILKDTDFTCADLRGADFSGTTGIMWKQLENEAENLSGAIKPDGTSYVQQQPILRFCPEQFEPALSFSVSDDSWRLTQETTDGLSIIDLEANELTFSNPLRVVDPSNLSDPKEVPAPENTEEWASWFQSHPYLDTSEPVQVSVGGASGVRIDVTDRSVPKNYPKALADYCGPGPPCVPLFPYGSNRLITSSVGNKDQFAIVDVEGEPVVIDVVAPADKFDEFLPKAQKVLDTVEWKGT